MTKQQREDAAWWRHLAQMYERQVETAVFFPFGMCIQILRLSNVQARIRRRRQLQAIRQTTGFEPRRSEA